VDIWKNKKIQLANSPRLSTSYLGDIKHHTVTQDLLPVCNEWELLTKTMSSSPEIRGIAPALRRVLFLFQETVPALIYCN
jgi:hypothetical protein